MQNIDDNIKIIARYPFTFWTSGVFRSCQITQIKNDNIYLVFFNGFPNATTIEDIPLKEVGKGMLPSEAITKFPDIIVFCINIVEFIPFYCFEHNLMQVNYAVSQTFCVLPCFVSWIYYVGKKCILSVFKNIGQTQCFSGFRQQKAIKSWRQYRIFENDILAIALCRKFYYLDQEKGRFICATFKDSLDNTLNIMHCWYIFPLFCRALYHISTPKYMMLLINNLC